MIDKSRSQTIEKSRAQTIDKSRSRTIDKGRAQVIDKSRTQMIDKHQFTSSDAEIRTGVLWEADRELRLADLIFKEILLVEEEND